MRYERQLLMSQIGETGQKSLKESSVAVIGAGGLGSPILLYLTAAGIGNICIIDDDILEVSNLNRQIIHNEHRLGEAKALSAEKSLNKLNSTTKILSNQVRLTKENILEVIGKPDLIIDAVDNVETRVLLNKFSLKYHIPIVFGAVESMTGYLLYVDPNKANTPCYECLFPKDQKTTQKKVPIIGCTAGVVGSWQASEAIKILTGQKMNTELIYINLENNQIQKIAVQQRKNCRCNQYRHQDNQEI